MSEITRAEKLCEWVIAYDYYDGPLAGIGLRSKSRTFLFFKAVAWDEEHWKRAGSDGAGVRMFGNARWQRPNRPVTSRARSLC
jgi:hypothetical protein